MKTESSETATDLPDGHGKRVAIVSARFHERIADWLEEGARRALRRCGVEPENVTLARVPGCFELPLAVQRLAKSGRFDAIVALGAVVRGETPHFEYVAGECARGLMDVQLATGVPLGFGVLTTETLAQAEQRADPARGGKGFGAAVAALAALAVG